MTCRWICRLYVCHVSTALYSTDTSHYPEVTWVVDNGASRHCSAVLSDFTQLKTSVVGSVSGIDCEVKGVGDVEVKICNKTGIPVSITLKEVIYVPGLRERSKWTIHETPKRQKVNAGRMSLHLLQGR